MNRHLTPTNRSPLTHQVFPLKAESDLNMLPQRKRKSFLENSEAGEQRDVLGQMEALQQ